MSFTKTEQLIVFHYNFSLEILAHSIHHTFAYTLSISEHCSNKNNHSIPFFFKHILCEPYIFFFLTPSIFVTPHRFLTLLTFTKTCSVRLALFFPFQTSVGEPTLIHRAHSSNENLLYIKHYTLFSRILIVNSSYGLKVYL